MMNDLSRRDFVLGLVAASLAPLGRARGDVPSGSARYLI